MPDERTLSVSCPHCGMRQVIPQDMLGDDVDCPGCNVDFTAELDDEPLPVRTSSRGAANRRGERAGYRRPARAVPPNMLLLAYATTVFGLAIFVLPCMWMAALPVCAVAALINGFLVAQYGPRPSVVAPLAVSCLAAVLGFGLLMRFYVGIAAR